MNSDGIHIPVCWLKIRGNWIWPISDHGQFRKSAVIPLSRLTVPSVHFEMG